MAPALIHASASFCTGAVRSGSVAAMPRSTHGQCACVLVNACGQRSIAGFTRSDSNVFSLSLECTGALNHAARTTAVCDEVCCLMRVVVGSEDPRLTAWNLAQSWLADDRL